MNLDNIEKVQALGKDRNMLRALRLLLTNTDPDKIVGAVYVEGYLIDGMQLLSHELWISCLRECCSAALAGIENELRQLGVSVQDPEPTETQINVLDASAFSWKAQAGMYQHAWRRELGPHIRPKTHLIDALVLGTRELREKVEKVG